MRAFIGRHEELGDLARVHQLKKSALIVAVGRRRVGKSRLIQEFASHIKIPFIEVQGLAPRDRQNNQSQLEHFSKEISRQMGIPAAILNDWSDAFSWLARECDQKPFLIFLDEISWMGRHDPDFSGKLKNAWDLSFSKNQKLRLVLCGSVSSWIEKNILNSTDFLGRISLAIRLKELSLAEAHEFWGKKKGRVSDLEKLRILNLTGGIPRYLEEINYAASAEENYRDLCFSTNGLLFQEFGRIFNDLFERRSEAYLKIVRSLAAGPKNLTQIAKITKLPNNRVLSDYLRDLDHSGYIRKEVMWDLLTGKATPKIVRYRISDCYLRFFLKFIEPNRKKIEQGLWRTIAIEKLPEFNIFTGLQFEALIQNNIKQLAGALGIAHGSIENAGPFLQTKHARRQGCQIDLLIQTKTTLYVCELKAKAAVSPDVVEEMKEKIGVLKYPKATSIRPVLIYAGELDPSILAEDYFDKVISLNEILNAAS